MAVDNRIDVGVVMWYVAPQRRARASTRNQAPDRAKFDPNREDGETGPSASIGEVVVEAEELVAARAGCRRGDMNLRGGMWDVEA